MARDEAAPALSEAAQEALKRFEECLPYHRTLIDRARRNYRAYRGVLERDKDEPDWISTLAPMYANQIVETTIAALMDERLQFRVKPRPRLWEPGEAESAMEGARAHEILHGYQLARDRFSEKQRAFVLQNAICELTIAKTFWRSETRVRRRLEVVDVGLEEVGVPGMLFDLREVERAERVFDGPCTEVVNIEDFFWHEAAVEMQRSPLVAHRVWMHFNELKLAEKQGIYRNVDQLGESRSFGGEYGEREAAIDDRHRTKDMVEVLEIYYLAETGIRTITLGNRKVELREDRKLPFWHGEHPFVVASTHPELFTVTGMPQAEKLRDLQQSIWDLLNQTHDNLRLINNFIVAVNRAMVPDLNVLDHEPGARWPVEGPLNEALQQFKPDPLSAQVALPHIRMLQADMQNLSLGHPFTSTSEASRIGADTATEAALATNIAQQATIAMRRQLNYAYQRIGQQRTELNQQFIRRPILVEQIGLDQASEFVRIAPHLLQGEYDFDIAPMNESLMRAERRAEGNALLQVLQPWVGIQAGLAAVGAGRALNTDALLEHVLRTGFGIDDPDRFFSSRRPAPVPGAAAAGEAAAGESPNGVTAPQAIDPAVSPSAQASLSAETMLAREGARRGGVSNV